MPSRYLPLPTSHTPPGLPLSSTFSLCIKSMQVASAASIHCYARALNTRHANLTIFELGSLTAAEPCYDCNSTKKLVSHERKYHSSNPSLAVFLWMLSLPFSLSLMRRHDWQEWWGHITSHLVSSAATCAPQCHRAPLCPEAPGFHLSKCSTTPHLARLAPRRRQPQSGHVWRHTWWQAPAHRIATVMLRKQENALHQRASYTFTAVKI